MNSNTTPTGAQAGDSPRAADARSAQCANYVRLWAVVPNFSLGQSGFFFYSARAAAAAAAGRAVVRSALGLPPSPITIAPAVDDEPGSFIVSLEPGVDDEFVELIGQRNGPGRAGLVLALLHAGAVAGERIICPGERWRRTIGDWLCDTPIRSSGFGWVVRQCSILAMARLSGLLFEFHANATGDSVSFEVDERVAGVFSSAASDIEEATLHAADFAISENRAAFDAALSAILRDGSIDGSVTCQVPLSVRDLDAIARSEAGVCASYANCLALQDEVHA